MKDKSGTLKEPTKRMLHAILAFLAMGAVAVGIHGSVFAAEVAESAQSHEMTVYKSPSCGCCDKWVEHLQENDFEVDVQIVNDTTPIKLSAGVPRHLGSCHTAIVGDYWVEGHVPADLIQKLLDEQPENIKGITVPGMPAGSPGMESPNPVTYQILSVDEDGKAEVYATRKGEKP